MLRSLSSQELIKSLEVLSLKEHEATLKFLECLAELDHRKGYLKLGYSSTFALCVKKLKYSEPAAYRRICSARVIRNYPMALKLLEKRAVSLTTLTLIHPILTGDNAKELLENIAGKPKEIVERIVASHKSPQTPKRDTVRVINVQSTTATSFEKKENAAVTQTPMNTTFSRESKNLKDDKCLESQTLKFKINFEVSDEVMKKLKRLREIRPYKNLEELFELLMDSYLMRHAPENKRVSDKPSQSRITPGGLRAFILKRDNYQCTFVGAEGKRCTCRSDLEIDHIRPTVLGGKTEVKNLRTLCGAHNRYEARRVLAEVQGTQSAWN